jgi:hypothetical protein
LGARNKLNEVNVLGSLGIAGLLGLLTGSWAIFAIAGALMIVASVYSGGIRPGGGRRR